MRLKLLLFALPVLATPLITQTLGMTPPAGVLFWVEATLLRVAIPLLFLFFLFKSGVRAADLGLSIRGYSASRLLKGALFCTLAFLLSFPIRNIAALYLGSPDINILAEEMTDAYRIPVGPFAVVAIAYYAFASAIEEVMFRGVLAFVFLEEESPEHRTRGRITYIVASTLLFTAIHFPTYDWADLLGVFYIGIVAAVLYIRYRNLWFLIFAHVVVNCIVWGYWSVEAQEGV